MQVSHYRYGVKKVGFMSRILEVGFSGTVVTIWVDGQKMMNAKSNGGLLCVDMRDKLSIRVVREIFFATENKDKHYCIGHTMVASCSFTQLVGNF